MTLGVTEEWENVHPFFYSSLLTVPRGPASTILRHANLPELSISKDIVFHDCTCRSWSTAFRVSAGVVSFTSQFKTVAKKNSVKRSDSVPSLGVVIHSPTTC